MTKAARAVAGTIYVKKTPKGEKKILVETALTEIYKQHGMVNQGLLVDYARPMSSPLHDYFEWNDKIAGEKYRENQALHMIMASKFVILLNAAASVPPLVAEGPSVRKLLPALKGEGFKMRYEILEQKDTRAAFINLKRKQLETWCRETSDIDELRVLREAILALL